MDKSKRHFASQLAELLKPSEQFNGQKLKLIVHVGTPKTGTTSVQRYLDKKQRKLRGKGILYPHNLEKLQNPTSPKHQWCSAELVLHFTNRMSQSMKCTQSI